MAKQESLDEFDDESLVAKLADAKKELFNLRFQHATGQLENSSRLGVARREVARVHTELRAREIAAAEELAAERENA
jgi:large subunit ribosomal protein L29